MAVEAENIMAYTYFFNNMRALFRQQGCEKEDWTFISDRMSGVDTTLNNVFPKATRRVCARHLYSNFKIPWSGGEYHKYFWIVANAYNPYVFNKAMEKMSLMDPELWHT
ncbi:Transposase for insertion sequence element IS1201 [Bienertia sinuspersici]